MFVSMFSYLASFIVEIKQLNQSADPAYLDVVKMVVGITGWVGGLTLYMWIRDRRRRARDSKQTLVALPS
jgi:hypothetical protein